MAENQFNPALPLPIKWSIGDDRFNEGQQVLNLTIPVDSVPYLTEHLMNLISFSFFSFFESLIFDNQQEVL